MVPDQYLTAQGSPEAKCEPGILQTFPKVIWAPSTCRCLAMPKDSHLQAPFDMPVLQMSVYGDVESWRQRWRRYRGCQGVWARRAVVSQQGRGREPGGAHLRR